MTSSKPILVLAFLIASTLIPNRSLLAQKVAAQSMAQETITPFITKDLPGLTSEEFQMYTVDFPPGFSSPIHRHNAQVSVYVLEGSVVMQIKGGGKKSRWGQARAFMKVPTIFTLLAGMRVVRNQQNSLCF